MTSSNTQNIKWQTYHNLTDIFSRKILITPRTCSTWNHFISERITGSFSTASRTTRFPTIPRTEARNSGGKTSGETWVFSLYIYFLTLNHSVAGLSALWESVRGGVWWPVPGDLRLPETDPRRGGQGQRVHLQRLRWHPGLKRICKHNKHFRSIDLPYELMTRPRIPSSILICFHLFQFPNWRCMTRIFWSL